MKMWSSIIGVLVITQRILAAPVPPCPKSCSCTESGSYLEAECASLDFLQKPLATEQITSLTTLVINNGSVIKTNPNLSNLSHLRRLSLASNKIQHITAAHLPKSLEYLDLSWNSIKAVPEDLLPLTNLTEIDLSGNPLACDCGSLSVRDALLEKGVIIKKPVVCGSPKDYAGESWLSVKCKEPVLEHIFEDVQADAPAPDEGSGSGEGPFITEDEADNTTEKWDAAIENEFIRVNPSTDETVTTEAAELEGSGEEETVAVEGHPKTSSPTTTTTGDDDYDEDVDYDNETTPKIEAPAATETGILYENTRLKACNFNCSTPTPINVSTEAESSGVLGILKGADTFFQEILGISEAPSTVSATEEPPTTPVVEEEVKKSDRSNTLTQGRAINLGDKAPPDAEVISTEINEEEKRGSITENKDASMNNTYIFLGIFLVGIICLVVYSIVKKRSLRRSQRPTARQPEEKEALGEELELLKKPVPQTDKLNGTHEGIPLMNGNHNENQHKDDDDDDVPDAEQKDNNSKPSDDDEYVDLRLKKPDQNVLLTPATRRVTIKAGEIPNSTPKTPILVTRHINSDGSVVTTPTVD